MKKKLFALLLVMILSMSVFAGCGKSGGEEPAESSELTEITCSEFRGFAWLGCYLAEAEGFYEEEGLKVNWAMYDDGPVAFQGMHQGDSDFCLLSQEPVLKAQEEGLESKFIYTVLDTRLYGFVSNPDIKDVADLKGKAIFAGMQGSAPYSFVSSILREAGLDPEKDVTFVNMDYSASMAALAENQIQASYINIDNRVEIQKMDINVLVDTANPDDAAKYLKSDNFPGEIVCCTKKFAEENPETVQKYVNALSKADEWFADHSDEEVADAIAPYFEGMDRESLITKIGILRDSVTKTGYIGEEPEKAVQDFCINCGVIKEQIPYEDVVDMTFVDAYQSNK